MKSLLDYLIYTPTHMSVSSILSRIFINLSFFACTLIVWSVIANILSVRLFLDVHSLFEALLCVYLLFVVFLHVYSLFEMFIRIRFFSVWSVLIRILHVCNVFVCLFTSWRFLNRTDRMVLFSIIKISLSTALTII